MNAQTVGVEAGHDFNWLVYLLDSSDEAHIFSITEQFPKLQSLAILPAAEVHIYGKTDGNRGHGRRR